MRNRTKILIIVVALVIVALVYWIFFKKQEVKPSVIDSGGSITPAKTPSPVTTESFPLSQGMQGMNVKRLQTALNWIKPSNNLQTDGVFGSQTVSALYRTVPTTLSRQPITEANFNQIIALGNKAKLG